MEERVKQLSNIINNEIGISEYLCFKEVLPIFQKNNMSLTFVKMIKNKYGITLRQAIDFIDLLEYFNSIK